MKRALPIFVAAIFVAAQAAGDTRDIEKKKPGTVARVAKPAPAAPPRYAHYVKTWHTPTAGKIAPVDASGRPLLVLFALNSNDRLELQAGGDHGGFGGWDLDRAAFLLRETHSGNEHPIEPRLLDVVYRIQTHFAAHEVRVVSGYRTPHGAGASNHGRGRAIDLVVPGASDEEVAKFAREAGFVGVGLYPSSGFVHVDVRDRSYFWVDASGPGKRNRERGVLGDLAKKSDAQAMGHGERPTPPFSIGTDVDLALGAARGSTSAAADEDDDVE